MKNKLKFIITFFIIVFLLQSQELSKEDYRREVLIGEYYSLLKSHKNKEALALVEEYFPKHPFRTDKKRSS